MKTNFTHSFTHPQFKIRKGDFRLPGANITREGVNFCIESRDATSCELVLFHAGRPEPFASITFPPNYKLGHVYAMEIVGLDYTDIEYGYRFTGPYDPANGYIYDSSKILLDPYAKLITGRNTWGRVPLATRNFPYRGQIVPPEEKWPDEPLLLNQDYGNLIIYEAHLRGFTKDKSANCQHPGTFAGFREKIPYLQELGINAVELLPIFEFDEHEDYLTHNIRYDSEGNELVNYWGYNTVGFFAPKAGYASKLNQQITELKELIRDLHQHNIRIILDVVFNHTAELGDNGPYISFKGIDNKSYYMLTPNGSYLNFSGCGNTVNCNNPQVRMMILNCLRYWISEFHIDGFRFDLASILGRNQDGTPMQNPPLLELLSYDPLLSNALLIAEAWDAGGLYQVGSFPSYGRWAEWNGRFRDDLRHFIKGDSGYAKEAALRIAGSTDIYDVDYRGYYASINFITCHDGFTLWDLYSYNEKHNLDNGWNNNDGSNDNISWNCGVEGPTTDETILGLRHQMIRNCLTLLFCSKGIPMLLAGDEFGNSQQGNNNAYCQDNEISWIQWQQLQKNYNIYKFTKNLIQFRKEHPLFCGKIAETPTDFPSISYHSVIPWQFDSGELNRVIGVMFTSREAKFDDFVYIGVNSHWVEHELNLPELPQGAKWKVVVDTSKAANPFMASSKREDIANKYFIQARSVIILNCQIALK